MNNKRLRLGKEVVLSMQKIRALENAGYELAWTNEYASNKDTIEFERILRCVNNKPLRAH